MMLEQRPNWICCHFSAREHYIYPRALHSIGRLKSLIVDAWVRPHSFLSMIPGGNGTRLRERFHHDLEDAPIIDFTAAAVTRQLEWRVRRLRRWDLFLTQNDWFQRRCVRAIRKMRERSDGCTTVFAHSYSALQIFREAKARGLTTVLGQIDPAEGEERLVKRLHDKYPHLAQAGCMAPLVYWENWRAECQLADKIIVNSDWSRQLLIDESVPAERLHVVPLAYEPPAEAAGFERSFAQEFNPSRPLRALFLGQANLRKGIAEVLDAMQMMSNLPIQLWVVGPIQINVPDSLRNHPQIRWVGPVSRDAVVKWYRDADVLLFPTHSDGFGMVQIEAQGWRLPIIASRNCGAVVSDGVNGIVLPELSAEALARALQTAVENPELLQTFSRNARGSVGQGLKSVADRLAALEDVGN